MLNPADFPFGQFDEAWKQVVLFDEHTWGAHNSVSEPDLPEVIEQWEYKRAFAGNGEAVSRELLQQILPRPDHGSAIDVYNTNSWRRSGLVVVPAEWSRGKDLVKDQAGRPVPTQRLRNGDLAMMASDVPALGAKRFVLEPGEPYEKEPLEIEENRIDNGLFSIEWDAETGTFAMFASSHLGGGIERPQPLGAGLNEYIYIPGKDPREQKKAGRATVTLVEAGPLVADLRFESEAPGCISLVKEIRIVAGIDHLEIVNTFDKKKVRDKESIHFAFRFAVPDGILRADTGWGVIEPEKGQLPGACKDFLCVHNWVDISGPGSGVSLVTLGSPLVEPGSITSELQGDDGARGWKREVTPGQVIYSYAANNYWHTNYKADQEGPVSLRYAIRLHEGFEAAQAKRFGVAMSRPLLAVRSDPWRPAQRPLFDLQPDAVIVSSIRPSGDGKALIIRLYNASESRQRTVLVWQAFQATRTYLSSPFEEKGQPISGSIELPPFGIATLRAEK